MKKIVVVFVILAIFGVLFFCQVPKETNSEYLRIHIRANSNCEIDQNVKLNVRDSVVDYLIPILAQCETKAESMTAVEKNLDAITSVAEKTLQNKGFSYGARASIRAEDFPTRSYGDLTLESGFYDALILELGSGEGNNWWCVVYPPLCFVNGGSTQNIYKSRILEIIRSFG